MCVSKKKYVQLTRKYRLLWKRVTYGGKYIENEQREICSSFPVNQRINEKALLDQVIF